MIRQLIAVYLLIATSTLSGQRYFFENIGVSNGLPASKVYDVLQDSTGLLWLCTEGGLAVYDGQVVSVFNAAQGLSSGVPRTLFRDREERLWCGHLGGGLSIRSGRAFQIIELEGEALTSDVSGIAQDVNGVIWVSTFGQGVLRITGTAVNGKLPNDRIRQSKGIGERITNITRLRNGTLVFLDAENGLLRLDLKTNTFIPLEVPGLPPEVAKITSFFEDSKGNYWIGTQDQGAYRSDLRSGQVAEYNIVSDLPSNFVFCFGEDDENRVWMGTWQGGIAVINDGRVLTFTEGEGLHSANIRKLLCDREGNMVIATNDEGVDVFKGARFRTFNEEDGLVDRQVWAALESRSGKIWFGTNNGLTVLDPSVGGTAHAKNITMQGTDLLTSPRVRCLKEDARGHIWIGTADGGLVDFDPEAFRSMTFSEELSIVLPDNRVTALETGAKGDLWIGSINGLVHFLPGSVPDVLRTTEGLGGNNITALYRDPEGTLWTGSAGGGVSRVSAKSPRKAVTLNLGSRVTPTCFTLDIEGRLWVGTEGQGILVLQDGKRVGAYTTENGLLSNNVRSLITDGNGHVWVGTNKGLNKWRKKKDTFLLFTERSGFTGIESKTGAVCRTRSGDLWFGTANGAVQVRNEKGEDKSQPPIVSMRSVQVDQQDRDIAQSLDLSHTERDVRIAFACVSLSDPGAVRYQYKLEGLNDDWQPVTADASVNYQGLNPGKYYFRVKAQDRSGEWSDQPATLQFVIHPPWYRSWWFYTAMAVVVSISVFFYIKFRERQLRLRNVVLEQKVTERTAEVVKQSGEIAGQKVRIESLLLNILPKSISDELNEKGKATARRHEEVTVMFTDMKGFTRVAEKLTPEKLVDELDGCFVRFDDIIGHYGIEKIKTIGDSYMSACGVPSTDPQHAVKAVMAALEIREDMRREHQDREASGREAWVLRIGLHSGPVVAGVVGKRKFAYDIWGDAVNTASRMESSGEPGEVNISGATYELVKNWFVCEHRGQIAAKNKGAIDMYFVRRIKLEFSADPQGLVPNERFRRATGLPEPMEQSA